MLASLASLVAFALVGLFVQRELSLRHEIADVKEDAVLVGRGIIAPQLTSDALVPGTPQNLRLDTLIRREVITDEIVRLKIWRADGTVVYSDLSSLVGRRFPLEPEELAVLDTGEVTASVTELDERDNADEREFGKLLEVYMPITAVSGETYLFEMYHRFHEIAAGGRRLWLLFAVPLILSAFLLWAAQAPLAWSLVRRLRAAERERERLLVTAIETSNLERRRIAADLHDGIVQQLAGTAYTLESVADAQPTHPPAARASLLHDSIRNVRQVIRQLRSLIVEIHPPNLRAEGLAAAIGDLATRLPARGIDIRLDIGPDDGLSEAAEELCFRGAQEALRNVAAHSGARHVEVSFARVGDRAVLLVADDGDGFAQPPGFDDGGHLGLTLLGELATDLGGTLEVDSAPGAGTRLRLEVPWT
jgi:signal transduction histidine kinase